MGQLFFSGGMMPSVDLLAKMGRELYVCRQWKWNGRHYRRTANAWLANLDAQRDEVLHTFRQCYSSGSAEQWFHRWRTFFMAVSELFGFANGDEWFVSHYLMSPHELIN
jgi:cyclopropane-fatty-acyl-phospholipid synthase